MIRKSVTCPVSIGRAQALAWLIERLDRAISGNGSLIMLGGDAGVGKSRLVRELKRDAVEKSARIIEGRCSSTESSVPYAPLMDALRFRISRGEGEEAAKMLGPLREILAPLFPQLAAASTADDRPGEPHPNRPFELIFNALARLARQEPTLLILEDVHWADQTSLEVLHHLAHRAPQLPLLVIATFRSDELHSVHPLRRLLGLLARDRVGEEMRVEPLNPDETAEMLRCMLGAQPDPQFAAAIWRRSEGNPFFVEELVTTLAEKGPVTPDGETAVELERSPLPATVTEAIMARVSSLGPREMEALSVAAVMGRTFAFDDLREVLETSEEELTEVIEQLVAHQLIREESVERYGFPHALMQEALYASVISRRRRLLHRKVASALERRMSEPTPTRLDQLAYHFRLGGDNAQAHKYARLAGDEAVRLRAWDDAAEHYENALASLEFLSDDGSQAADLLERLASVAWRQSRVVTGRQFAEEALRLRRSLGHEEESARLLRRLAALHVEEGDHQGASDALDEALRLLGNRPDSPELGPIYDDLGRLSIARGDLERAETLLKQGMSIASRDAESAEEVLALVSLSELSVVAGRVSAGVTQLDVALALLREGRLPFERLTRAYAAAIRTLMLAQEYDRALQWAEAARALCQKQSVPGLDALFRSLRAAILTLTGSSEDTLDEATAAVRELRGTERGELRDALRVLGFVHRARGELSEARKAYEEALGSGSDRRSVGLALVALAEGRMDEAANDLESALVSIPSDQPFLARQVLPYAIEALIGAGRLDRAVELVAAEAELPDPHAGTAQLAHAKGLLLLAQRRAANARDYLAKAAEAWDHVGNRFEGNRARVALLEATLIADGASAGSALGRRLLDELGRPLLPREREVVRRVLRRAGIRTRPVAAPVGNNARDSLLTTREQAVLREVAQGHTNREIAISLGIAEKTVGVHVSHILAKLGCKTRTQAARFANSEQQDGTERITAASH